MASRFMTLVLFSVFFVPLQAQAQLSANFSVNTTTPTSGCAPHVVQFVNTSTGNPVSYFWNLGNGVTSVLANPSTTYLNPGSYTVTLTVTDGNGATNTKVATNYINVFSAPTVVFSANNLAACPPLQVNFTNTTTPGVPGPLTYQWSFGDGSPFSTVQNPAHLYPLPGYYTVSLTATNSAGCISTLTKPAYLEVYAPPVINFSATPASYCDNPANVTFNPVITGTPPYIFQWDFGDGGTSTTASPTHTYSNAGTYTVRLIVQDGHNCIDTLVKNNYVTIGTTVPAFTAATACANTQTIFYNNSVNGVSYHWDFGDGGTDTAQHPTHIYAAGGVYNVKLVVYNGICADSVIVPVTVHPAPAVQFSFTPPLPCPAPVSIQFNNTTTGAATYAWDFGDGGSSSLANPAHTYQLSKHYPVKLTATSAQGCVAEHTDTVRFFNMFLYVTAEEKEGCIPHTTKFSYELDSLLPLVVPPFYFPAPLGNYPYPVVSWFWDFGDGGTSTQMTPSHTFTNVGIYRVKLTLATSNGCVITDSMNVMAGLKPAAAFLIGQDSLCPKTPDTFTSISTGPSPLLLEWDFGEGAATGVNANNQAVHYYNVSGTYTVTLVASHYGCKDTMTMKDTVTVLPPTSFFWPRFNCDTPLKIVFVDTSTIGATSRLWLFGDGTTDTAAMPTHVYPAVGTYHPRLITYNSQWGCVDTGGHPLTIADPKLTFSTPDTGICMGDSINFTPSYTGYYSVSQPIYIWWIDTQIPPLPGDTTYGAGVWGHRFDTNGLYTINLRSLRMVHPVFPQVCVDTVTRTSYILVAQPTARFMASPPISCVPMNVLFTDTSTNTPGAFSVTRTWDFGNGTTTVTTPSVSNIYHSRGLYPVQLVVTDNIGCTDTSDQIFIDARDPAAAFTCSDSSACIGTLIQFNNNATGFALTHQWDFGDGQSDTARNPVHSYMQTGVYTVRLIVTDSVGCKDTLVKPSYITISKPVAAFSMSDSLAICPPLNVTFVNASAGVFGYSWDLGNSTTSALPNPTGSYVNPGTYTITLVATSSEGCKDTASAQVSVLGYAGALTYTPINGCAPLRVKFRSSLFNIPSIVWDFSDGVTAPANGIDSIEHVYQTPGAYVPKLILSDNTGCQNSSAGIDTIRVDAVIAGFTTSPPCVGNPVTFLDTSFSYFTPITAWSWRFQSGQQTSSLQHPVQTYTAAGRYAVSLVATNAQGCTDSIAASIEIFDLPLIQAVGDTSVCSGDPALLTASGGVSYQWAPAASLSCPGCQTTFATPTVPTAFVVTGTDSNGCRNTDTVGVSIQYLTTSTAAAGGAICEDSSFQLLASGAQRYEWSPAVSLNDHLIPNPLASPQTTTIYTLIAWEGSCLPDTSMVQVVVYPKPVVDAGTDVRIVAGAKVMLQATGTNLESFLWSPAATLSCETCSNPYAGPPATTTYKVMAQNGYGCKAFDTVTVHILCDNSQLFIPNTFSPNADGQNDLFYPRGAGLKTITSFRIYNRWGELLFERRGIQLNDVSNGWDGSYKGAGLSPDTYVYVLNGICDNDEPISWHGDVTLLR